MKKVVFRQRYATDGNIKVITEKVEEVKEEKEEKKKKKK